MNNRLISFFKKGTSKKSLKLFVITIVAFILSIVGLVDTYHKYNPLFISGQYFVNNRSAQSFELPFRKSIKNETVTLNFVLLFGNTLPEIFNIDADDCLERMEINGKEIKQFVFPSCTFPRSLKLNLSEYIQTGNNTFKVQLSNYNGPASFNIIVSRSDSRLALMQIVFYALILLIAVIVWKYVLGCEFYSLIWLYAGGIIVRAVYMAATPTGVREHDYSQHLIYIKYMAEHLSAPFNNHCAVCYHPPLYYFLNALWYRGMWEQGLNEQVLWNEIQLGSFILSVISLGVGLWIGTILFSNSKQKIHLYIFGALISFFPGLILLSSRTNNDSLLFLFCLLLFGFLLKWWKDKSTISLIAAPLLMGFGLLVKGNILVLFPVAFFVLIFKNNFCWKKKFAYFLVAIFVIYTISKTILPNPSPNSEKVKVDFKWLQVENTFLNLSTFNPLEVIKYVYNNPGSDQHRRQFFLEYLYRSAFFGEFNFGPKLILISRTILLLGVMIGTLALIGFCRELKWHQLIMTLPIWLTFICAMSSLLWLRIKTHLSSTQDFRYIPIILLPVAYYVAKGTLEGGLWLRYLGLATYSLLVLLFISFFIFMHMA